MLRAEPELLIDVLERVDPTLDQSVPFVLTEAGEAALEAFVCEHGHAALLDLASEGEP